MRNYRLGTGKWVFIDWVGVEPGYGTRWPEGTDRSAQAEGFCVPRGMALRAHQAEADPTPVIVPDRPWERVRLGCYITMLEDAGRFRCWYEPAQAPVAYAESDDGVEWRKPELGITEFDGSRANNLTNLSMHGHGIFKDPSAPAAERYKCVGCHWAGDLRYVRGAVSPDGFNWTCLEEPILARQHADTKNVCRYDEQAGQYVLYTRQTGGLMQRRGVNRAVSPDFTSFPSSTPVLESNPMDPVDWDIYCSGYAPWPGATDAHLMRLSMYGHTTDGMALHLATSRDELVWHRPLGRTPWLKHAPQETVYAADGVLRTSAEEWATYGGALTHKHNEHFDAAVEPDGAIYRIPVRADGFMSLAARGEGAFWTISFVLDCDRLVLNTKTAADGYVACEILSSPLGDTGAATRVVETIDGFTIDDCTPLCGDHHATELAWRGGGVSRLRGKSVRLHFVMKKADLFAITFGR